MNIALAKTRIMTNLLMLLHFCFKYISGTINFDLYYTFYNCIFRICNSIYTFIFLLVQLISGHIDKSFNCLRGYKLNILNYFFSIWVIFHNHSRITGLLRKREEIFLTPHYHFQPLHSHLDFSRVIIAESSSLHIGSSRDQTGNLCFPSANR